FPQTTQLCGWVRRMAAGDEAARNELFSRVLGRLEALAGKMLADYPSVRRWAEAADVLQDALLRLERALHQGPLSSVKGFLGLAAVQTRRELIALARQIHGPEGVGANHASDALGALERGDDTDDPARLAEWCEMHRQIERLPAEEREVVELLY